MPSTIGPSERQQPTTKGSFFSLFPELQNRVYWYALSGSAPSVISTRSKEERLTEDKGYAIRENRNSPLRAMLPSGNALLHTCRQAYHEAARYYYEENKFVVFSDPVCRAFTHSLNASHVQAIQHLSVNLLTIQRPVTEDFYCRRSGTPEGVFETAIWRDDNFMNSKQLRRLAVFQNLRTLTFGGRCASHCPGYPVSPYISGRLGPSISLLRKLIALGRDLKHLETVRIASYLHRTHARRGRDFTWRPMAENALKTEEWTYSKGFIREYLPAKRLGWIPPPASYAEPVNGRWIFVVETLKRSVAGQARQYRSDEITAADLGILPSD